MSYAIWADWLDRHPEYKHCGSCTGANCIYQDFQSEDDCFICEEFDLLLGIYMKVKDFE